MSSTKSVENFPIGTAAAPRDRHADAIDPAEIARAARALVDAYGPRAIALMRIRTRAVRRRGDSQSAMLWSAVAQAVEAHLAAKHSTAVVTKRHAKDGRATSGLDAPLQRF